MALVGVLRAAIAGLFLLGVLAVPLVAADDDVDPPAAAPRPTVAVAVPTTSPTVATTVTTAPRVTTTTPYRGPVTRVRGRVVDEAGRPAGGVEVHVYPEEGWAGLGRIVAGFASLGTYCLQPDPPLACRDNGRATTARNGTYTVELLASPEELRDAPLYVSATRSGAAVRHPLTPASASVQAPDLPLWGPGFRLDGGRASWRPVAVPGAQYTLRLTRVDRIAEEVARFSPSEPAAEFDARLLEDFAATASLTARAGSFSFSAPETTVRGPGPPPTRDRPCTLVPDDAQEQPVSYDRCPATDTDPHSRLDARPAAHSFVIDLGTSRSLSFAVVRNFSDDPLFVEVSEDGSQWVELVRMGPVNVAPWTRTATAPQPRSGRYVRFRSEDHVPSFFALASAAVW